MNERMEYEEARRKARQLFGPTGDVRVFTPLLTLRVYEVGVVEKNIFRCLGAGNSWEKAFEDVRPTNQS